MEQTVKVSLFASMLSVRDAGQVVWSNQAASTGKRKGLVHSKGRVVVVMLGAAVKCRDKPLVPSDPR